MTKADNLAVVRRFIDAWQSGDLNSIDEIVAPDYVGHVAAGDRDRDGLKDRILTFRAVFLEPVFTIESQIGERDLVATRILPSGTHAETDLPTRMMGFNFARVRRGRLVEEWSAWEAFDQLDDDLLEDMLDDDELAGLDRLDE